jgi:predicted DnaQ family exonuclease/DinG family helicase
MFDTLAAICGRTEWVGPQDCRLVEVGAVLLRDGAVQAHVPLLSLSAEVTPPPTVAIPEDCVCLVHGAEFATQLRQAIGMLGRPTLDIAELAGVLYPALPEVTPATLLATLGLPLRPADGSVFAAGETLIDIFAALLARALALPLPVIDAIQGLTVSGVSGALPRFFQQVREVAMAEQAAQTPDATLPGMQTLYIVPRLPRPRLEIPEPEQATPLDPAAIDRVLGPDGELAAGLPAYEFRAEQVAMSRAVGAAFSQARHLLVEAGTGVGKSLGYLVPAVLWAMQNGTPVVISTNTKNLQQQLFLKDLPLLRHTLGLPFKAALIKGRQNYLCIRKLLHLVENEAFELEVSEERLRAARVLTWSAETETGDLSELADWERACGTGFGAKVTSTAEECAWRACRNFNVCFLRRARAHSLAADIVVANHSLVFAEMGMPSTAIPPHRYLVFDEAHNLEESATRHFSVEVSWARLRYPCRRIGSLRKGSKGAGLLAALINQIKSGAFTGDPAAQTSLTAHAREVVEASGALQDASRPFFQALGAVLKGARAACCRIDRGDLGADWQAALHEQTFLTGAVAGIVQALDTLADALRLALTDELGLHSEFLQELAALSAAFLEFQRDVSYVLAAKDPEFVFWVERAEGRGDFGRAVAAPVAVGGRLWESLYQQKASIIFCSATMSVRRSFGFLADRLGIGRIEPERLATFDAGTPFDYASQTAVFVPMFLPEPGSADPGYVEALGDFLGRLFRLTRGRAMTLFTSYDMLQRVTACVESVLKPEGITVLAQGSSGSRNAISERFRDDIGSVLMGTHSFWEGVDMVGETLSCLVLARLPFAVFTDPIVEARCEQLDAEGRNAFTAYSLPQAVIRFRQGFGRLIRHRNDRGIVVVADNRIVTKRYGQWFRDSIPAPVLRFYDEEALLAAAAAFLAPA